MIDKGGQGEESESSGAGLQAFEGLKKKDGY